MTKELVAGISADVYNLPLEIPNDMVIIRTTNVLGHDTGFSLSSLPLEEGQGEGAAPYSAVYACDHQGRMVWKQASATAVWINGTWQATESRAFIYDGWNVIAETITASQITTTNHYVWGLDLSGSLQGAGGIGGLLSATFDSTTALYSYDANGNVGQLVGPDGDLLAHYEYSPFGETIVATGPLAAANPFRFSTKWFDNATGLGYWGYRWYSPGMGRWMSRDPIEENDGADVYGVLHNKVINEIDYLGLLRALNGCDCYEHSFVDRPCREEGQQCKGTGECFTEHSGPPRSFRVPWRRCNCKVETTNRVCRREGWWPLGEKRWCTDKTTTVYGPGDNILFQHTQRQEWGKCGPVCCE